MCFKTINKVLMYRAVVVILTLKNSENAMERVNYYSVRFCRKYLKLIENNIAEHADLDENSLRSKLMLAEFYNHRFSETFPYRLT